MYYLKHADEQAIVADDLPEHLDTSFDGEPNDRDDSQAQTTTGSLADIDDWFASDDAAFWMSL